MKNRSASIMSYSASNRNPPKGYGSISAGITVMAYRSERLKYWRQVFGVSVYNDECFINAEKDVLAKFGKPF